MSWQGKMIGGGIGSFLGPWGAVLGATVGHFMVDRKQAVDQKKEAMKIIALLSGAFHELACCDGAYSKPEDQTIRAILSDFNARLGGAVDLQTLMYLIDDAERIDRGVERLASAVHRHRDLAHEALRWLWYVAVSDGSPTQQERLMIDHFIRVAHVAPQEASFIESHIVGRAPSVDQTVRGACDVLGVPYDAKLEAIKQAYRTLSLKYHPDKHATLDPDIRALTAEKFAQIKQAYDTLCAYKGMKA